nr:PREDICTED: CMRF35-like molecule 4 isoform X1 [Anolis carolinensis]XP_008102699.1 PREDICTED: CMRF35-like molecule 4 isoform X1 [Anolis carolinensis]|eukprot:XP_008102698.1 PREDICTED: CMRF35-like molecule 4 isoform X1 [Anolis carolinensis]
MDSLLQWHLIAGVLFLLTGFTSALVGPEKVSGFLGNPLSLVCKYEEQFKNNIKCWCKGAQWSSCMNIVKTDGTEQAVRNGRTIIKDNHTNVEFTVTLENLTEKDAGKYWCVIEKIGADIGFPLSIEVLTASAVNASLDDEGDLPTVNIIHQMTSTTRPQDTVTTEKSNSTELIGYSFPSLDSSSLSYRIYLPILISIGLKTLLLLCLGFAMFCMHRKNRGSSDHVASEKP